jgi:ABC-type polysaccharide/polyol phosphate export permease
MAELFRYRALLWNLVLKDLRVKYRNSVLGVAWSLLNPLLLLGVYTFAFQVVLRIDSERYPYFLLTGLLPWTFFAGSLVASTHAITGNADLLRKVHFPREVLPIGAVLFAFAQLLLALAAFVPTVIVATGATLPWTVALVLPLLLLLHLLFTVGLALVLSAATVFFRDVRHLTEVALLLLFWTTPVVYPLAMVPAVLQPLFQLNPLAAFVVAYQDVLYWGRLPGAGAAAAMVVATLTALAAGQAVFRRWSPWFAEEV